MGSEFWVGKDVIARYIIAYQMQCFKHLPFVTLTFTPYGVNTYLYFSHASKPTF